MQLSAPLIILSFIYLIFVLVGQFLYKKAAMNVSTEGLGSFTKTLIFNPQLWLATALYMGAMVVWVILVKHLPLSRLFPAMSAMLLLSLPLMTYYFLGEPLSLRYWMGVLLILSGIALIATEIPDSGI